MRSKRLMSPSAISKSFQSTIMLRWPWPSSMSMQGSRPELAASCSGVLVLRKAREKVLPN